MADNLLGLGGLDIFPVMPNWVNLPKASYVIGRYFQGYAGTSQTIEELTPHIPLKFGMGFLLDTKNEEHTLIDFFHNHRGRLERFWIRFPREMFRLKNKTDVGGSVMECYPNFAESYWTGDERIYIEMANGDLITRDITLVEYDEPKDVTAITLATTIDRDLNVSPRDYVIISKLVLGRFVHDTIEIKAESNIVSTLSLDFLELNKEYSDV